MKSRHPELGIGDKLVARFGRAALVQRPDGKWQLKGGSRDDRTTATEWISLFMHEVVLVEETFCMPRAQLLATPASAAA